MSSITNLVPIRVDAWSSDGAVRVIDTLLIDTTCLPITHAHQRADGNNPSGLNSLGKSDGDNNIFSLSSLIDANAAHLTESILADAEVYGTVRTSSKTFMGGRLELLGDAKLYQQIEKQIRTQLGIALSADKKDLMSNAGSQSNIVRIKLRLRHENIVVFDEFDYDINSSGYEGCDPFSIANSLVEDLKLPPEMGPTIAANIVEQCYGVDVTESLDGLTNGAAIRQAPTAFVMDSTKEGSANDFTQIMLSK